VAPGIIPEGKNHPERREFLSSVNGNGIDRDGNLAGLLVPYATPVAAILTGRARDPTSTAVVVVGQGAHALPAVRLGGFAGTLPTGAGPQGPASVVAGPAIGSARREIHALPVAIGVPRGAGADPAEAALRRCVAGFVALSAMAETAVEIHAAAAALLLSSGTIERAAAVGADLSVVTVVAAVTAMGGIAVGVDAGRPALGQAAHTGDIAVSEDADRHGPVGRRARSIAAAAELRVVIEVHALVAAEIIALIALDPAGAPIADRGALGGTGAGLITAVTVIGVGGQIHAGLPAELVAGITFHDTEAVLAG